MIKDKDVYIDIHICLFIPLNWEEVEHLLYFQLYESPSFLFY